jgi:RimJ/RimL family protein N-acetyltransferase
VTACGVREYTVTTVGANRLPDDRITLRAVKQDDAALLFQWRNEPSTRSMFFSNAEVDWDSHVKWLDSALRNPSETLLIGRRDASPVGVVRFSTGVDGVTVSLTVSPDHRRRGYGRMLLEQGIDSFRTSNPRAVFLASVRVENSASLKVFEACNFVEIGRDEVAVSLVCPS